MKRLLAPASAATLIVSLCLGLMPARALAAAAAPTTLLYTAIMRDSQGAFVTQPLTVRLSFWTSTDFVTTDRNGSAINEDAPNYTGWSEVQNVTPAGSGLVLLYVGSINPLPELDYDVHKFLQVEVKGANQSDADYQLIDIAGTGGTDSVDRRPLFNFAYAQNTRMVDGRMPGTGSGDLLLLTAAGTVDDAQMGDGTNASTFTIDADSADGDATLSFGNRILPATLTFSETHNRFEFSASVRIEGDLTVTGTINGFSVDALAAAGALSVSAEDGLSISVAAGAYSLNGNPAQYSGTSGVAVPDNAITAVYLDTDGLQVSEDGFPASGHIPLAQVRTVGGSIVSVLDVRALLSDDRETQQQLTLHSPFEGSSTKGDGSNNVGMLYVDFDATAQRNFYLWTSTQSTLQDYEINIPVTLPPTFLRWRDGPLVIRYRSSTALASDNSLDVSMTDTAGQAVTLGGTPTSLASTAWAQSSLSFGGTPTWTPGGTMMIKLKVSARDHNEMHVGPLELHFDVLQKN